MLELRRPNLLLMPLSLKNCNGYARYSLLPCDALMFYCVGSRLLAQASEAQARAAQFLDTEARLMGWQVDAPPPPPPPPPMPAPLTAPRVSQATTVDVHEIEELQRSIEWLRSKMY